MITIHDTSTSQKDRQTTCRSNNALCVASHGENVGPTALVSNYFAFYQTVLCKVKCRQDLVLGLEFLADRTNGRAYATVLRLSSVCRLSVTLCIVAKRCALEQKVTIESLEVVYEKSIGSKMNDLGLCLKVIIKVTSTIALH